MGLKNQFGKLALIVNCYFFPIAFFAQPLPRFQEAEGVVIVEIESASDYGSWELDTAKSGYTGSGYLIYKGSNLFNDPGRSLLNFEIAIEKAGKYRFQWHSLIAVGESNTEHNDSWLRFKDANDFYGQKGEEKVYPKGVGKSPNPEGSSARGWMKIYQNNRDGWTWQTRTSDRDPHDIFVEFDTAAIYTLEVSGRSNGHAINRLALYHSDVSAAEALDLNRPESDRIQTTATTNIILPAHLKIRPSLAVDFISIDLPAALAPGRYEVAMFNLMGQPMSTFPLHKSHNRDSLPISTAHLHGGYYVIRIEADRRVYQGIFLKQ